MKTKKFLVEQFINHKHLESRINALFACEASDVDNQMYRLHDFTETRHGYTAVFIRVGDPK